MKTFILAISLIISATSEASYYQTDCSNPDASVQYFTGHSRNQFLATFNEAAPDQEPVLVLKEIKNVTVTEVSATELENTRRLVCSEGSHSGMFISKEIAFRKVVFTKTDGSNFPANLVGVSEDLKSLPVNYLCETNSSGRAFCE